MKRTVVVILAVAILGALGAYVNAHGASDNAMSLAASTRKPAIADPGNGSPRQPAPKPTAYKDGTYAGQAERTIYGTVRVAAVISNGKISDIKFLQMPNDLDHTRQVTAYSEPLLKQETLSKQSGHIDFVSGATQTSEGYQQSLQSALDQAVQS